MSSPTDVIVIGAGAAGLSAAKECVRLGLGYVIVEGSHRIGGRAYSEEIAPGIWFDLGCSYLHQADSNPFVGIADELGFLLGKEFGNLFHDDKIELYENGVRLPKDEHRAYFDYRAQCCRAIRDSVGQGLDVAISELIDLEQQYAPPFINSMAILNAVDVDRTSAADFMAFSDGLDFPVLNGYGNLVAAWGEQVPVSLNTRVERIEWSGHGVTVATNRGDLRARTALCTVSTGILAAGDIDFAPALPDWKVEAIHGLPIGTENKICLLFDRDVFGPDGRGFHNVWNDSGEACGFEASVMGQNTAVVFTGGRHAIWLEKQGQQAGHDYAVDRVAEAFGNDIRKHVTRSIVTAWTTEPWTLGSYSCALPGQAHQRRELTRPLDERLFFAGEATTIGDQACCHGALRSGVRAAREISATLSG